MQSLHPAEPRLVDRVALMLGLRARALRADARFWIYFLVVLLSIHFLVVLLSIHAIPPSG